MKGVLYFFLPMKTANLWNASVVISIKVRSNESKYDAGSRKLKNIKLNFFNYKNSFFKN